ncbi:MAG: patatin-like phospholipase family protein [Candidatus Nanopelagicales bacterium]
MTTAFVLGGGGHLGAHEVGMLRALLERAITPDLVIGTSIGAINGAFLAADPSMATVSRLAAVWASIQDDDVLGSSLFGRLQTLARTRTHTHSNGPLRRLLTEWLPVRTFEELAVPFQCTAASIERAAPTYFSSGELVPAILASSAVPGLLPPVRIGNEHFLDGGIVDSIPLGRALELAASTIYVLQVGRVEQPLTPPTRPWEVALVAFEIARRHRFAADLESVPDGVAVHVLPTGAQLKYNDPSQLRDRGFARTSSRIERSYAAATDYLLAHNLGAG